MGGVDVLPAGEEEAYVSSSAKEMVVLVFVCKAGGGIMSVCLKITVVSMYGGSIILVWK